MANPYEVLGVARDADEATIKKAYRKLAKLLHPDRNAENPAAAEKFSAVTAAYDLLTDKEKRAQFDRGEIDEHGNPKAPFGFGAGFDGAGAYARRGGGFRHGGGPGATTYEFSGDPDAFTDIFEGLFGGAGAQAFGGGQRRSSRASRGADIAYRLAVSFEDAAALRPQRVTLAHGRTVELQLPAGLESGAQVRLPGHGDGGAGAAGDAIITIEIQPHRFFTRDGDDVRLDLPIRLDEAVLGAKIKVPTVDGPVLLTIPKGSSSGRVLRVKGKGFHRRDGGRGNQLVRLLVDLPSGDEQLEQFVRTWSTGKKSNPRAPLGV
jgi:DnaJ-class molecular chaperone